MMIAIGVGLAVAGLAVGFFAGVLTAYWSMWDTWNYSHLDSNAREAAPFDAGRTISTNPTVDTSERDRSLQAKSERPGAEE